MSQIYYYIPEIRVLKTFAHFISSGSYPMLSFSSLFIIFLSTVETSGSTLDQGSLALSGISLVKKKKKKKFKRIGFSCRTAVRKAQPGIRPNSCPLYRRAGEQSASSPGFSHNCSRDCTHKRASHNGAILRAK